MKKSIKKILGTLGIFFFCLVGISAVWLSFHEAETSLIINSESEISFSNNFGITNLNETLTEDYLKLEAIQILNTDGIQEFEYLINTTIIDYDGDGCNNFGDLETEYIYDGNILQDNGFINISTGQSFVNVSTSAKAFSCPQSLTSNIILSN